MINKEDLKATYTEYQIEKLQEEDLEALNEEVWDFVKKLLDPIIL